MERLWREMEVAGRMADPLCIEDPETVSERSRLFDALKEVLTALLSERRESRPPSAGSGPQTGMVSPSGLSRRGAESLTSRLDCAPDHNPAFPLDFGVHDKDRKPAHDAQHAATAATAMEHDPGSA